MNLGLTQTVWNRVSREMALWLAMEKVLTNEKRRYSTKRNRIQIRQIHNDNGFTGAFRLTGVKIGVNTNEDGRLFVRIADETPGANQARVSLYKATGAGGGDLVAQGSANNSTTLTLAEQNSSGISGTVPIGVVSASEANDSHYLEVYPDWGLRARSIWDGSVNEDTDSLKAYMDMLPLQENAVNGQLANLKAAFSKWLGNRYKILMESGQTTPIEARTKPEDGAIITSFVGLLEDGRRNMADETSPAAQTIVKNVVAATAGTFPASNRGEGSADAPTVQEWAPIGTLKGVCSIDSAIGRELFDLSITDADGTTYVAENKLEVGEVFSDPKIGIFGLLVEHAYSFDAPDNNDFATVDDFDIENESASNTADGVLWLKIVAGTADPAKFSIEYYKSSSYDSGQLVGKTTEGAANAIVTIKQRNSSGLGGTCKIGDSPTAGETCELNLNPFRSSDDDGGVADEFTIEISSTSRGEFAECIARLFRYRLNSAASGAETIDDSYVSAGTFPAFDVLD